MRTSKVTLLSNPPPAACKLMVKMPAVLTRDIHLQCLTTPARNHNPPELLAQCKLVQPLWENVRKHLVRLDIYLLWDAAIPRLGKCPRKEWLWPSKDIEEKNVGDSFINNRQNCKHGECSSVGTWIKHGDIHSMEFYMAIKRNEILLPAMVRMDLADVMINKTGTEENVLP